MRAWLASALVIAALAAGDVRAQVTLPEPLLAQVRRDDPAALDTLTRHVATLPEAERATPALRYLEGRLAERATALPRAIAAYESATPLPEALARDARQRRARLLVRAGRCSEATALLADARLDGAQRALLAECAIAASDLPRAIELLGRSAEEDAADVDTFAIRMALAEAHARAGDVDRARSTLRRLRIDRPEHPDLPRAEAALRGMGGDLEVTLEERMQRAERLDRALLHARAAAELDVPLPRDRESRRRLLHLRGMALFRSRHAYADAARVLTRAAALGGPDAIDDAFHAARALSRSGDDAGAIRGYRNVARRAGATERGAEAEYLAAWLEMRGGRRSAATAMERFVRSPRAARAPSLLQEARWELALDAFRRRRYARAADLFRAYAELDPGAMVRGRGTYWRGRALLLAGDRAGGVASLRAAIRVSPLHWYALLAHDRLVALGEDAGSPFAHAVRPDASEAPAPPVLPEVVTFLRSIGLDRDAREALHEHEAELRRASGLRGLAETQLALGDAARAARLASRLDSLEHPAAGADLWAWRAAYPYAFEPAVRDAAAMRELAPELLWGVMKQESGYDPDALSYADAVGLMQLLPATGERVARGLAVPFRREMLFDPAWNVRLGATYVAGLVRDHGVPLAFGAFNAGGHRIDEWLARSGETDLDLFVEEIPIEQTRNYVRRVTTHYAHYVYLRDPNAGWPNVGLPERVAPRP